jgi:hypothetical protein
MAICEICRNDYDKSFQVIHAGTNHTFDSFECATHTLAPICAHCGCLCWLHLSSGRFLGHDWLKR